MCVCVVFFFSVRSLSLRHSQRLARTPHGHNSLLEKGDQPLRLAAWQPGTKTPISVKKEETNGHRNPPFKRDDWIN